MFALVKSLFILNAQSDVIYTEINLHRYLRLRLNNPAGYMYTWIEIVVKNMFTPAIENKFLVMNRPRGICSRIKKQDYIPFQCSLAFEFLFLTRRRYTCHDSIDSELPEPYRSLDSNNDQCTSRI